MKEFLELREKQSKERKGEVKAAAARQRKTKRVTTAELKNKKKVGETERKGDWLREKLGKAGEEKARKAENERVREKGGSFRQWQGGKEKIAGSFLAES